MLRSAKAAVYDHPRAPLAIWEFPLRDVGPSEALVRVSMSSICRSDIHSYQGLRPNPCPGILGHEIVGVLEQLGAGLQYDLRGARLKEGDRVTWTEYFWSDDPVCRDVRNLPQKTHPLGKYGHEPVDRDPHLLGGFAEYCYLVPHTGILRLPDALTDREAVPLNCGAATMIAVCDAAGVEIGDVVVVLGLGLLGLYGCAIARARGARLVIGIDTVDARVPLARHYGAHEVLQIGGMSRQEVTAQVRAWADARGADVVIEVCGNPAAVAGGIDMLRLGGRCVLAGLVTPNAQCLVDGDAIVRNLVTLRGVHNYHPRHLVQAVDFALEHRTRYPLHALVDAVFPLAQINEAMACAAERRALRAAIVPHPTRAMTSCAN